MNLTSFWPTNVSSVKMCCLDVKPDQGYVYDESDVVLSVILILTSLSAIPPVGINLAPLISLLMQILNNLL